MQDLTTFSMSDFSPTSILLYVLLTYVLVVLCPPIYQSLHKHYRFFTTCSAFFVNKADLDDFMNYVTWLRMRLEQYEQTKADHDSSSEKRT
jgi:hypothetical protein